MNSSHSPPAKITKKPPQPTIPTPVFYEIYPIHRKFLKITESFTLNFTNSAIYCLILSKEKRQEEVTMLLVFKGLSFFDSQNSGKLQATLQQAFRCSGKPQTPSQQTFR